MVIKMDKTISMRKTIVSLIQESRDEDIKGAAFRKESWLSRIDFSDVMDIVIFYISLQPDIKVIGKTKTNDFYHLMKDVWMQWAEDKKNKVFSDLSSAWYSQAGPMDGYAGPAEMYMMYHPGLLHYKYLLEYFFYPEELPGGWSSYRDHMKIMVFPKWRREKNYKKIPLVFNLAGMACEAMRKKQSTGR
jgi:hypothetical protein